MKSLIVTKKNDYTSGADIASLLSASSELCSIINIITFLDELNYNYK